MDRYQKVEKPKPESPVNKNEIRITSQGLVRNYVSYATSLLQERKLREIVLKAMGQAISKTVAIAEIIKKRVPRLHQDTGISSVSITDTFEPIEEGLQTVEQTRHVSMISIILSTKDLNMNSPGYQAPSNMDQSRLQHIYLPQQRQPPRQACGGYNSGIGDTYGRGRGHGPDRGRDWNRGGYSNYQDNGGYSGGSAGYSGDNGGYRGGYAGGNAGYRGGYAGGNSGNRGGYAGGNSGNRGGYAGGNSGYRGGYAGGNGGYRGGYSGGNGGYYQGGYAGRNGGYQGSHSGGYRTWGRGDGRSDYHGDAFGRGRGGGGRGFGRGRGRMGSRGLAA